MTLKDDIEKHVQSTFQTMWSITDGRVVPDTDNLALGNVGRKLDATVLYADLADSTGLVNERKPEFAAEIYKTYLYSASRIITATGGSITAFDGDRVMGVFVGDSKNSDAGMCALRIAWAVDRILQPALEAQYAGTTFKIRQKVGIDSSELLVAKTGVRGSNDLVWVGTAANNAAKMAALDRGFSSYISGSAHDRLNEESKLHEGKDMWTNLGDSDLGYTVYGSNYIWGF